METNAPQPETRNQNPITAVVLAAGVSRRMGDENKLLLPLDGRPLVVHAVESVRCGAVGALVVVTGHDRAAVENAVADTGATCVHNPGYEAGMASSLVRGVQAADETSALLIHLGDVPHVRRATVQHLCDVFADADAPAIVRPTYDDRPGHPVLFDAAFRPALLDTTGDTGARAVLQAHRDALITVPVDDPGVLRDVDTRDAYRTLHSDD
jgi:molybdenum cofactor cytidylyltransferase